MMNVLTVDVEDWYQTNGLDIPAAQWDEYEDRVADSTLKLLALLEKHEVKATFFILGCVALKHPELVKEIDRGGHEIGSHGGWHQMLNRLSIEQFREDLLFSKHILEQIIGRPVTMYRAPSWSIDAQRFDYLTLLSDCGFLLDSSIQPFRTPLSGISNAPTTPFYPIIGGRELPMLEVPSTVADIGGVRLPFSGGFYFRALPYAATAAAIRYTNRTRPAMIYIHPWELDQQMPQLKLPRHIELIQYYGISSTERKLGRLLKDFQFQTLGEMIAHKQYPSTKLC